MNAQVITRWVTQEWWPFVESATLGSLLVFAVVAVVWMVIRRRASAHLGYALFLLPLVPFVLPLQGLAPLVLPADAPLARLLPVNGAEAAARTRVFGEARGGETLATSAQPVAFDANPARPLSRKTTSNAAATSASPRGQTSTDATLANNWPLILFALWFSVVVWLSSRWVRRLVATQQLARQAAPVRNSRLRLLAGRAAKEAGYARRLRIVETERIHSPAVFGLVSPTLLLPTGFGERLDDDAIVWSLHHELAHLHRRDLWAASIQRALAILWWFHPTVWFLNRVLAELRECACDEAALARMPHLSRRHAARALVDAAEAARRPATPRLALALTLESLHSDKSRLEKRIMRLINPNTISRLGLTPSSRVFLSLTALAGFATTQLVAAAPSHYVPQVVQQEPVEPPEEELEESEPIFSESILIEEGEPLDEPAPVTESITLALNWIVQQQNENGSWDTGDPGLPMAGEFNDVGVTALAIECLLWSPDAAHLVAVKRALGWLASVQDPKLGLFGKQVSFGYNSGHALATRIWIRAHMNSLQGEKREVAERAVKYILKARNPYGAWRFDYPPIGENDTFVTSLMLRALVIAKRAGLEVERDALIDGKLFLDQLTDPSTGRTGYYTTGGESGRLAGKDEDFPRKYSEYPTAMAILARLELGEDPVDSATIISGSGLLARLTPKWDPVKGTTDGYYWLYGTSAMRHLGGVAWLRWQRELYRALIPSQHASGAWPLMDAWSGSKDRVHIACVYTLALQAAAGR